MSYRRNKSSHELWLDYCQQNEDKLSVIGLQPSVLRTEDAFKEYLTYGTVDGRSEDVVSVAALEDKKFWLLFDFVDRFDMPFDRFDEFEASRLSRC